jgi:transcriptional regulator with XRE-family HTH domain
MTSAPFINAILANLKAEREKRNVKPTELEEALILGPGWIERFESGATVPTLDMLLAILQSSKISLNDLLKGVELDDAPSEIERHIYAVPDGKDLNVHFKYANFDAVYRLPKATTEEFEAVIKVLRDGLARLVAQGEGDREALKTDAVAKCFLKAVKTWPHANPSDLWWFLVGRAYCDPFNHPAQYARMSFEQSWKRTGGWALEQVLVRHYGPTLAKKGIEIVIGTTEEKENYLRGVKGVTDRLEADKADVLLLGKDKGQTFFFGVVHVKASFAERRTDDVPMSKALVDAGYCSPLWTMDSKSGPAERPINRGELGDALGSGADNRSAKRKDIEDDGYFSACFSYNKLTKPTPEKQKSKGRIYVCDFTDPDDAFSKFVISHWQSFAHK